MKKHVVLDVDGVILDYTLAFLNDCGFGDHINNGVWYDDIDDLMKMPDKIIFDMILDFNASDKFGKLPPVKGAPEALKALYDKGFDISIITSCANSETTKKLREENLLNVFGDIFTNIDMIPLRGSKKDALTQYKNSGIIWVEDKIENYYQGLEVGLNSVLLKTQFNRHQEDVNMVDNWDELYNLIINYYD